MIKRQRGATLIELMIGMVLGLSLIAGIGSLFVQSQKSFRLQQNLSDMTDDAAFVLESLAKGLYQACSSEKGTVSQFLPDTNVLSSSINFNQNECIHGTDNTFIYRFQLSDPLEMNTFLCNSTLTYQKDSIVSVRIYKANDSDGTPVFYCKVKQDTGTTKNAEPLISEVKQVIFKYGVKITNTATCDMYTPCFYFADAATITTNNDWQNVYAVKVFLVMQSKDNNVVRVQTGYKIDNVQQVPSDKRLYKTFTKTIYLRNT